ncbi:putative reverse transcriptase domain-containing protein [Tanacetum coccineum]
MYLPTTSESSAGDSSSELSAGPSHKRCRSPTATMNSSIHATRALVYSHAVLLPSRKRFRDSISPKDNVEKDIDTDVLEDIEVDAIAVKVLVDRDVKAGVDAGIDMEVDVGVDLEDEVEDEVESSDRVTMEVRVDVVVGIDIPYGGWSRCEHDYHSFCDGDNGNGGDGNGGNGNPNANNRDARPVAQEYTYQDFMNNCSEKYQVKYATCTLLNSALTWWNSHKRTIGAEAAFAMSWRELMKLMAEVYCPRNEIQKIESELWNLTMKNNDLAAYT